MQGTLAPGVLPGLLRDLYVGRKTGLVSFTRAEERRSVRMRRGNIVDASTNVEADHLGAILVKQGLLKPADNARCMDVMAEDGKRLGQVLLELELMSREQVAEALALHVREVLLKVLTWNDGSYVFEAQEPDASSSDDVAQRLSTGEMILEAVRRVGDAAVVRYGLGNPDRVLIPSSDPLLRFQQITLSPVDGFLLSRVDGTLSAREVIGMAPVPTEDAEKSLFGLLCTGVLEFIPGPPKSQNQRQAARSRGNSEPSHDSEPRPGLSAREEAAGERRQEVIEMAEGLRAKNHFEVLGIPRASTEAQVKEAYFRLVRRFHPDTQHDPALADLAADIEAIFIRVGQAYDVLRNKRSRAQYEERLGPSRPVVIVNPTVVPGPTVEARTAASGPAPPEAELEESPARLATPAPVRAEAAAQALEVAIRVAEKLLAEEKYWDVIQTLEPRMSETKGRVKHRAQLLIAKAYLKNPNWIKKAEEELQELVHTDPTNIEAYLLLGDIYKKRGLKARAIAMFRKALELKPDLEPAAAALQGLGAASEVPAAPASVGSFLKKLFGKD